MNTVVIMQRRIPHYRVALFERLRMNLARDGVRLRLLVVDQEPAGRSDDATIAWAEHPAARHVRLAGADLAFTQLRPLTRGNDLLVLEHAATLPVALMLPWLPRGTRPLIAYWGHGANLQSTRPNSIAERSKRAAARRADWWFSYTQGTAARIIQAGFPADRVTVLNNAVDTDGLRDQASLPRPRARRKALFLGSLYPGKRIQFVLDVARILTRTSDWEVDIVGDGPDRHLLSGLTATSDERIRWHGPLTGPAKHRLLHEAAVVLMPGIVGLAVVEALAAGVPVLTSWATNHSPEFEYVTHDNSIILSEHASPDDYVQALLECDQSGRLASLSVAALASGEALSLDAMVERFSVGICRVLATGRAGTR